MKYKFICYKCGKGYKSSFWYKWHIERHKPSVKILNILVIISFIGFILFTPFFNGNSIWNILEGADVELEVLYPPSGNLIKVNYKNTGGIPLTGIYIKYSFGLDKEIFPEAKYYPIVSADLSTFHLERKESGYFYINLNYTSRPTKFPNCVLLKEIPRGEVFRNLCDGECYYRTIPELPKDICFPIQINITFFSNEILNGVRKIDYYPVSDPSFKVIIADKNMIDCIPYEEVENEGCLFRVSSDELTGWNESVGNILKLSKKYCKEGGVAVEWCVENT